MTIFIIKKIFMKNIILIISFIFFFQKILYSQIAFPSYIYTDAGFTMPALDNDFTKTYLTGPTLSGGIGFILSKNIIAKAEIGYNHFYLKNNTVVSGLTIISYLINLNFGNFNSKGITPFGIAGIGAYTLNDFSSSQTNIGFDFGVGISGSYKNNLIPFGDIQLSYNMNSGLAKGYIPVRIGIIYRL